MCLYNQTLKPISRTSVKFSILNANKRVLQFFPFTIYFLMNIEVLGLHKLYTETKKLKESRIRII
jgi:hypothetical protein